METQILRIRNTRSADLELQLLPWGDRILVAPGAVVELHARGPAGGVLEIESRDGRMVVYGWVGSVVTAMQDGRELTSLPRSPATWMD